MAAPLGPRDCPRAISRASGCKIPALGKSLGTRGVYFPIHPSSRQCTDTILKPYLYGGHLSEGTHIERATINQTRLIQGEVHSNILTPRIHPRQVMVICSL